MTGYGCEEFGRLKTALLHTPTGEALSLVRAHSREHYLFDRVPDASAFIDEHRRYAELLASCGVEVLQLADYVVRHRELMARLPNLCYLHDIAVVHSRGAILSQMAWPGRAGEEVVVGEALSSLGVPLLYAAGGGGAFEGCLLLSPRTVFVAECERHSRAAVERFASAMLNHFDEVVMAEVPKARRFMHPDTVLGRVSERLFLAYPPALRHTWLLSAANGRVERRRIDLPRLLEERGIKVMAVSDAEQSRLACTFVPLEPGVILHYEHALSKQTRRRLERRGVEVIPFVPDALLAGGGSLRCITLRLSRGPVAEESAAPRPPALEERRAQSRTGGEQTLQGI